MNRYTALALGIVSAKIQTTLQRTVTTPRHAIKLD
jgi:hypothetical protein